MVRLFKRFNSKRPQYYKVVSTSNRESLQTSVESLMSAGWECQGGVSTMLIKPGDQYEFIHVQWSQAMVRYVET